MLMPPVPYVPPHVRQCSGKAHARLLLTGVLPSGRWNPHAKLHSGRYLKSSPVEEVTLAEKLRDAGYQTAHVGKWHLGEDDFFSPIHHGFDFNAVETLMVHRETIFFHNGNWLVPSTGQRIKWNVFSDGSEGEYPHRSFDG